MSITDRIRAITIQEHCAASATIEEPILFRDPLSRAGFIVTLEDEFGIEAIDEDAAEQCRTLSDWGALIERHRGESA